MLSSAEFISSPAETASGALPVLKKAAPLAASKDLKYRVEIATARCAMSLERTETAVEALLELNHEFPHDPEVLYMSTHFYSELASRSSQEMAGRALNSTQAQQLDAESYESLGDWDRALAAYQNILGKDSQRRGIHYQIGRIFPHQDRRMKPAQKKNSKKN